MANETRFCLTKRPGLLAYRGSMLHGTFEPGISDIDLIGFTIPPLDYVFGVLPKYEQTEFKCVEDDLKYDVLIYNLDKFIKLLIQSNPNVLEMLWVPDKHIIRCGWQYDILQNNRHMFLSKRIAASFCGYANGQLHRIKSGSYTGEMGEKRKQLVDEHGYDTKNASSLILLLSQGIEFLETGTLNCERKETALLLDIKHGRFPLKEIIQMSEDLFAQFDEKKKTSDLPENINLNNIQPLVRFILGASYAEETIHEYQYLLNMLNVENQTIN